MQTDDLATLLRRENPLQRKLCIETASAAPADLIPTPGKVREAGPWARFLAEYTEDLRVTGYSAVTAKRYGDDARRFAGWLMARDCDAPTGITPALCIGYQRAAHYQTARGEKPLARNTQRRFLTAARSFTGFLKRRGYALVDPGLAIRLPRTAKTLPRDILTEDEVTRLLTMPDVRTLRGYRDRTILEVLYATGLRASELLNLNIDDVNAESGFLTIRQGKGAKDRVVPLGEIASEFLAGYIRNVRLKLVRKNEERSLFVGRMGRRLKQPGTLVDDLRRHARTAKVERHVVLHTFRHTCATHMLRGGAGIRAIQELLGHASLRTTERYTRVEITDLAKAHEEFHPRKSL